MPRNYVPSTVSGPIGPSPLPWGTETSTTAPISYFCTGTSPIRFTVATSSTMILDTGGNRRSPYTVFNDTGSGVIDATAGLRINRGIKNVQYTVGASETSASYGYTTDFGYVGVREGINLTERTAYVALDLTTAPVSGTSVTTSYALETDLWVAVAAAGILAIILVPGAAPVVGGLATALLYGQDVLAWA